MAQGESRGLRPRVLGGSSMLVICLLAAMQGIEGSILRLHAPGAAGVGWSGLRHDVAAAFERWEDGKRALAPFNPLSPGAIVAAHVGVSVLLLAAIGVVAWLTPAPRRGLWHRMLPFVAAAAAVQILLEAAVGSGGCCRSTYGGALLLVTGVTQVGVLLVAVSFVAGHQADIRRSLRAVRVVPASTRLALGVGLLIFAIPQSGRIGSQIEDVIERTLNGHVLQLLLTALAAAVHVGVMLALGRIRRRQGGPVAALTWYQLIVIGAGLAVVGVAYKALATPGGGFGLIVIGALAAGLGVLSRVHVDTEKIDVQPLDLDPRWDLRVLATATALPAFGLAVAAARLAASQATVDDGPAWERTVAFAVACIVVAVGGATVVRRTGNPKSDHLDPVTDPATDPARAEPRLRRGWVLTGGAVVLFGASPWWFLALVDGDGWQRVGNLAILLSVAPLVGLLLMAARFVGGELPPIQALRRVGINRVPVLTLAFVIVLLVGSLDVGSTYHDARVLHPGGEAASIVGPSPDTSCADGSFPDTAAYRELAGRFCAWLERAAAGGDTVDLVLVIAPGGGVRAAAWTGRVLDCVFFVRESACSGGRQPDAVQWSDIFAMGGASGGSVGVASAVAEVLQNGSATSTDNWARDRMGADFLAPLAGRVLLQQIPMAVTGGYRSVDGAQELERAWSAGWGQTASGCEDPSLREQAIADVGFLALAAGCRDLVPLLLLNGTDVGTGRRVNISPLDGDAEPDDGSRLATGAPILTPASDDVVDVLCSGEDLPLFTAAFMSARFPLVTPSAHLPQRHPGTACHDGEPVDVVDGGYYDNSGASQVHEVWTALAPMVAQVNTETGGRWPVVRPTLVIIETGEGVPTTGTRPPTTPGADPTPPEDTPAAGGPLRIGEALRPLVTALSARAGDAYFRAQLSAAVGAFRAGGQEGRVVTFDLAEHPGRRLPLGWTLGRNSADDIDRQLDLCINVRAAATLGVRLTGEPDPCRP